MQAGLDDAHVIGIGDLEIGLHHLGLAVGKPIGDEFLARRRRRDRRDLAVHLRLANHLSGLDLAIRLHGKEFDLPLVAEAVTYLVLLLDPEPGGLALDGQGEGSGALHAGAIEDGLHHIKQVEEDKQQRHQHQGSLW
jgi:hypothetical protein